MADAGLIRLLALDIDGVLTDGTVAFGADGQEQKAVSMRDVDAVFRARRGGIPVALVTGEDTPWVEFLSRRLELSDTVRGAKDKLAAVRGLADRLGVPMSAVCYVGDADRDAPALAAVGLGMAPADATDAARDAARVILHARGGRGAVHEAVSRLLDPVPAASQGTLSPDGTTGMDVEASMKTFRDAVAESVAVKQALADGQAVAVARAADMIASAIAAGHKVLVFGNGGSAADAQHFAAELVGRFERERPAFAAIALTTDTSILTALGNDYGGDVIFARQVEALARRGDVVVAISTSGTSRNVVEAVRAAARIPVQTVGMTGRGGGKLAETADVCIRVPSDRTARIQEAHGLVIHVISGLVEARLSGDRVRATGAPAASQPEGIDPKPAPSKQQDDTLPVTNIPGSKRSDAR